MSSLIQFSAYLPNTNEKNLWKYLLGFENTSKQLLKKYSQFSKDKKIKHKELITESINVLNNFKVKVSTNSDIDILYQDENFLVFHKPERLHSHPLVFDEDDNAISRLVARYPKLNFRGIKTQDQGLLYRLDYETSGIMYLCLNLQVYQKCRENFSQLMQEKIYAALVPTGIVAGRYHHVHFQKPGAKKVQVKEEGIGNPIDLEVIEVKQWSDGVSEIKIKLFQGHRHQIRAQLSALGYPILGDELYGIKNFKRLALHCEKYVFSFGGKKYEIDSPTDWSK